MSPSRPPKSRRSSPPVLPEELEAALSKARKNPTDPEAWDALDDVAQDLDRPEEVAALYREILESGAEVSALVELGRRGADFCEEWFEEPEPTVAVLERVLSLDRTQAWAFDRLTVLLTSSSSWEKLLEVYDRAIAGAESGDERANLLTEAARVARDFAGQAGRGSDYLKALLLLRPADDQLAASLERRLDEQARHEDLIEIWQARIAVLDAEPAGRTRAQVAARYLDALGDADKALQTIEELLRLQGDRVEAARLLEKLSVVESAALPVRRRALVLLSEIHAAADNQRELVVVTERALGLAETDAERIEFRRLAVSLLVALGRPDEALSHALEIVCLDPAAETEKELARRLATEIGRLDRYAVALVRAADKAQTGERRVDLLIETAHLQKSQEGGLAEAIVLYTRVLDDEAAGPSAELLAAQELSELLLQGGPNVRLLAVLERRARLETKAEERKRVLGQAAQLAAELGDAERALGLWAARLVDDPKDHVALSARIELLEQTQKFEGLVQNLKDRAAIGDDPFEQRADLIRAAAVYARELADLGLAIETWAQIEAQFGRDAQSVDALIALSAEAKRFDDVIALLRAAVAVEKSEERKVSQLEQLGDTLRVHLQKPADAILEYAVALRLEPTLTRARAGLVAILDNAEHAHAAAEVLAESLRKSGDTVALLGLLETRLAAAPDDHARVAMLLEASALWEAADELPYALRATGRAFALLRQPTVESEAQRLAVAAEDFVTLVAAYQKALEGAEGERARELHFAQGRVWETRLERPAGAAAAYKEAFLLGPESEEVALSLLEAALRARLFADAAFALVAHTKAVGGLPPALVSAFERGAVSAEIWDDGLESLGEAIARTEGLAPELTHDLKRQLALWHRDQRNDADAAEFVLRRATLDHPREDTLRMLADLERRTPGKPLVRTLEALADVTGDELAVLREACEIALRDVKDLELSTRLLERTLRVAADRFSAAGDSAALEITQTSEWAAERLVALAQGQGETVRSVDLLEQAAALPYALEKKVNFLFRAAEAAASLPKDERAVELCQRVLAADPGHEGAIGLLSSLHEQAGRLRELLELRVRENTLPRPLARRLFLRLDQARVLGELGEDLDTRVLVLRENLSAAPGHEASLDALRAILLERERFEEAATLLEAQAQLLGRSEPGRAAQLYEEAGNLAADKLADLPRLVADFKSASALSPSIPVLDRLAEIAHERAEFGSEVSWLGQRLTLTAAAVDAATREQRRPTVVSLARAQIAFDDAKSARRLLEAELALDPGSHGARRVLCDLYLEAEDHEQLAEALASGVDYAPDDATRVELLRSAAQIVRRQLNDVARATPLLERASRLAPDDRALRLSWADALRAQGLFEQARALLLALLEEFGRRRTKERAMVHEQLARIAQASGDLDEALEQAEAAAKIERTDAGILMLVGRLARQKGQPDRAEQAYRTLLLIVSRGVEQSEVEEERVGESSILFELYRIAAEEGQTERARELLGSALEIATRDPAEALRLGTELTASGQADVLLQALDDRLRGGLDHAAAAQVLLTKALVLAKNDRPEEALAARILAIEHTPDDARLLDSTIKLAEQLGLGERVSAQLHRLAEAPGQRPEVAGDLWYRLGAEAETTDLGEAATFYERAQRTGQRPRRTFAALDRVLAQLGDRRRTVDALAHFVAAPGADEHAVALADALYRLAEFEMGEGAWDDAVAHFGRALELDAKDARVLAALAQAHVERAAPPALIKLYVQVARVAGTEKELLSGLARAAELDDAELEAVVEAVSLARSAGDDQARARLLTRALDLSREAGVLADHRDLLVERAELSLVSRQPREAGSAYLEAAALFEGQTAFELELKYAEIARNELNDTTAAVAAYERLIALEPSDRRVWQALFALYRASDRVDEIERRIVEIEPELDSAEDRELLRMERVRILLSAGRFEEGEAVLVTALEERPEFLEAGNILSELLRDQGRHEEQRQHLAQLLAKARARHDVEQVAHYGIILAGLVRADDRAEAISILSSGLGLTKTHRGALVALLDLYQDDDDQADRAEVMEHLLGLTKGAEAVELALRLGAIRSDLGDEYGLGRALELGFRAAPRDPRMVDVYLSHLEQQEDFVKLAELRMLQAIEEQNTEVAAQLYAWAGLLFEEKLGDPTQAGQAFLLAFAKDPENPDYLKQAVAHLVTVGEVEAALAHIARAIEAADEMALPDLLQLSARTAARELPNDTVALERATSELKRALSLFVSEEQVEEIQQDRAEYLQRLSQLYGDVGDDLRQREVLVELARVQIEMRDVSGGVETLASWLRSHSADKVVALELVRLAMKVEDYDTAAFAAGELLAASEGVERVQAVLALAEAAEKAGNPLDAKEALLEVGREQPGNVELSARLRRTYELANAHGELAELLVAEARATNDPSLRYRLFTDAGDLLLKAQDGRGAAAAYEAARETAPDPYAITAKLADCYIEMGESDRARAVLDAAVEAHGKRRSPELSVLQHGLARVARVSGDSDGMYNWLEAALMSDRNNSEVAAELAIRAQEDGRYEVAIRALQMITLSKVPCSMGKAESYFRQAEIAELQRDPKKAALLARRALTTDEGYPAAQVLLDRLGV